MSWLYSRALVEEFSGANSSDGEPSAPLKSTHTAAEYFVIDRTTEPSTRSRFGTMSQPLMADRGEELLTLFRADFPVRTYQAPARGTGSKADGRDFGQRWLELSGSAGPGSCLSKTPRCFAAADLMSFSKISWRWGSMRNGECLERTTPEPLISVTGYGLWQTPVADDAVNRKYGKWNSRGEPKLSAQVQIFPTPRAIDGASTRSSATESTAKRVANGKARLDEHITNQAGRGTLNPNWVEWLMGWPIGHTALGPLETDRFRQWRQVFGES